MSFPLHFYQGTILLWVMKKKGAGKEGGEIMQKCKNWLKKNKNKNFCSSIFKF